ncbi:hypothetical protein M3212_14015 [Alkalihalobacillus oceani]|uniref:hypothetical protein n=1 Tax=Halalkalibacter oceani TaxID=1653776 RepID=UPI00203EF244|nr:hypothetical protein [Halalkalibacter oceani]MCM3761887.1 hypothetical protein [Halalkalibacter oceani]
MNEYYPYPQQQMRQQPSVQFLPPSVVGNYVNQWITTSISGYGQVVAYITDFNRHNGMVSMFMYQPPYYQPQFLQVSNVDLVGIAPYYGPIPPRPGRPPGGGGWHPGGGQGGGWHPGGGQGGGFWPWLFQQTFGSGQQQG